MFLRRSLGLPITLAVVMIVILVVLTVGWVLLAVFGALAHERFAGAYWAALSVGTTFIVVLLVGVIWYLALSVKAINLNRRQSNFIDSVTHDLKTPISSLKLYLQTLHRHEVGREQQADFYQSMLEDVQRLDRLINQVLDAGRLETQRISGDHDDIPLADVLHHCAQTVCLDYRMPPSTVRLDAAPCVVRARRADLDMIFRNLIDNAVKYGGDPPEVHVASRPAAGGWTVTQITDNGRGIPRPLRRKIFGRFVRLASSLERQKAGTGLGLHIVRTLVRRLRGQVRVRDGDEGQGTVFEVLLPGHPRTRAAGDGEPPKAGPGGHDGRS